MADIPDEFATWYDGITPYLARAADDVLEQVRRFISDWSEAYGFRCERTAHPRVKSAERVYAKCKEKSIAGDFDQLLSEPFAVGDLVGVRFVVRSRADVEAVLDALQNQGSLVYRNVEDLSDDPRSSGYRAVHINGVATVVVRDVERSVPFEVQVKTLAQDAWGYFTHDTTYVPTEANQHPRFAHVRELQRILADHLHVADLMQQQIEVQAAQIAQEVAAAADPNEVMFATVQRVMEEAYDVRLSVSQSQRLARLARDVGIDHIDAFSEAVAPDSGEAVAFADSFRADRDRSPTGFEVAAELLRRRSD